jgi:hypothetical protein
MAGEGMSCDRAEGLARPVALPRDRVELWRDAVGRLYETLRAHQAVTLDFASDGLSAVEDDRRCCSATRWGRTPVLASRHFAPASSVIRHDGAHFLCVPYGADKREEETNMGATVTWAVRRRTLA